MVQNDQLSVRYCFKPYHKILNIKYFLFSGLSFLKNLFTSKRRKKKKNAKLGFSTQMMGNIQLMVLPKSIITTRIYHPREQEQLSQYLLSITVPIDYLFDCLVISPLLDAYVDSLVQIGPVHAVHGIIPASKILLVLSSTLK